MRLSKERGLVCCGQSPWCVKIFAMSLWKIAYIFKEGVAGRRVVWFQKDLESVRDGVGHNAHPEVGSHIAVVRKAVEHPDDVREDVGHAKRRCYYTWFGGDTVYPSGYMKVVVKENWRGKLNVLTAYFMQSMKSSEKSIWKKT